MALDLLIHGGQVARGHGGPLERLDIGVRDGRIVLVDRAPDAEAARRIDAQGLVVSPGFIDVHSHADLALLADPASGAKTGQGVTTEVVGNCGWGPAPTPPERTAAWRRAAAPALGDPDLAWDWTTFGDFLDRVRTAGTGLNVASLVPHGTIRHAVRGLDGGPASPAELEQMRRLVVGAMDQGAVGLSGGLVYPPGVHATTDELVTLAREAGRRGGILSLHLRNYGRRLLDGVGEAIRVAQEADVRLQISHLSIIGRRNDVLLPAALRLIEGAAADGLDIAFDQQPYEAACSILSLLLPGWVTAGGTDATIGRFRDPSQRERMTREWERSEPEDEWWENYVGHIGWHDILIGGTSDLVPDDAELVGLTIAEAADHRGTTPADLAMDLWVAHRGAVTIVLRNLFSSESIRVIFTHPLSIVATDAVHVDGLPHPRLYGSYPRVLGLFVRDRGWASLGDAIAKMTGFPASRFRMEGRGSIDVDTAADLVVFDPAAIRDNTDYLRPREAPSGIHHVLVNGIAAGLSGAGQLLSLSSEVSA